MKQLTLEEINKKDLIINNLFRESIAEQIDIQPNSNYTFDKKLGYLSYNENNIYIIDIFTKPSYKKKKIELYNNLTDIGKEIARSYDAYIKEYIKMKIDMINKLNTITEKVKEDNAKYFILTQMTKEEDDIK